MRKITAQVVIQSGNGFVESGAYQSPTERDIFTQFKDENGNVTSINAASVTRFFTDRPDAVDIHWRNRVEDFYNGVLESGESSMARISGKSDMHKRTCEPRAGFRGIG